LRARGVPYRSLLGARDVGLSVYTVTFTKLLPNVFCPVLRLQWIREESDLGRGEVASGYPMGIGFSVTLVPVREIIRGKGGSA
jgi:hypothetical protein